MLNIDANFEKIQAKIQDDEQNHYLTLPWVIDVS